MCVCDCATTILKYVNNSNNNNKKYNNDNNNNNNNDNTNTNNSNTNNDDNNNNNNNDNDNDNNNNNNNNNNCNNNNNNNNNDNNNNNNSNNNNNNNNVVVVFQPPLCGSSWFLSVYWLCTFLWSHTSATDSGKTAFKENEWNVLLNDALHTFHLLVYTAEDILWLTTAKKATEGRKEMFYLTMHSTHFIYGYIASDIW